MFDSGITEEDWNKSVVWFEGEEGESIGVYRKCIHCGRYVKKGELLMNLDGDVKLKNWNCKKCGEFEPHFERFENE